MSEESSEIKKLARRKRCVDCPRGRKRSLADSSGPEHPDTPGQDPGSRHSFNWERVSMAAALTDRGDRARIRLCFQTRQGTFNDESLVEFLHELRRHFRVPTDA